MLIERRAKSSMRKYPSVHIHKYINFVFNAVLTTTTEIFSLTPTLTQKYIFAS